MANYEERFKVTCCSDPAKKGEVRNLGLIKGRVLQTESESGVNNCLQPLGLLSYWSAQYVGDGCGEEKVGACWQATFSPEVVIGNLFVELEQEELESLCFSTDK
eukprot:15327881-Ditylum_brightwellii.AAC.1